MMKNNNKSTFLSHFYTFIFFREEKTKNNVRFITARDAGAIYHGADGLFDVLKRPTGNRDRGRNE